MFIGYRKCQQSAPVQRALSTLIGTRQALAVKHKRRLGALTSAYFSPCARVSDIRYYFKLSSDQCLTFVAHHSFSISISTFVSSGAYTHIHLGTR